MSKLTDFYAGLDAVAPGWDRASYEKGLSDTKACAATARGVRGSIERMKSFIDCRRGKKVEKF